jgi:hypothetical protein
MKKLKHLEMVESDIIHSPFFPEEIRVNDGLKAKVLVAGDWKDFQVWEYSPFGLAIVAENSSAFVKNELVSIKLKFLEDELQFDSVKVSSILNKAGKVIVGFRTFRKDAVETAAEERRRAVRWACPQDMLPTGTAPNPLKFNDHLIFRVEDISKGGLRLITSMRNKMLYKGQFLESSISLPLIGSISITLKVVFVDVVSITLRKRCIYRLFKKRRFSDFWRFKNI